MIALPEAAPPQLVDAALPARWGRWQRAKNTAIYLWIRAAFGCVGALPLPAARGLGWCMGQVAALLPTSARRAALEHLAVAFSERTAAERREFCRAMFVHLALSAVELAHLERVAAELHLDPTQRALWEDALAEGNGVVAVTGHIGNWELLAQVVARDIPTTTIARPLYDPRLTRWVHQLRTAGGLEVIWRGSSGSPRELLRTLKAGRALALLIDQDTRVPGVFVPFFGRSAHTPSAAAALALRRRAPVIVGWIHRRDGRHVLGFERVPLPHNGDVTELTAAITERLEAAIRREPAQWVWMHRRWKTRPSDVVA